MPGFNIPINGACHDENAFQEPSRFDGPSHLIESARKHRYRLELMQVNGNPIFGTDAAGILLYCYKCTRPTVEFDEIVIHNGQDEIYRPGKNRWKPIDFTFYEVFKDQEARLGRPERQLDHCAQLIYDWWAKSMLKTISTSQHGPPNEYLAQGRLQVLDGVGNPTWEYNLLDCWPTRVSPSDMTYSDNEIADYTVTLRYQKCFEREPVL